MVKVKMAIDVGCKEWIGDGRSGTEYRGDRLRHAGLSELGNRTIILRGIVDFHLSIVEYSTLFIFVS